MSTLIVWDLICIAFQPSVETIIMEFIKNDIRDQLIHIKEYMKPKSVPKNLVVMMDSAYIQYEPYGVALVIGAWNYPIQLVLCPLVGAITAGNCAIIKPSEISDKTAQTIAELIPRYLNNVWKQRIFSFVSKPRISLKLSQMSGMLSRDYWWTRSHTTVT